MKWRDLFENWGLTGIKLNLKFAELEFKPNPQAPCVRIGVVGTEEKYP